MNFSSFGKKVFAITTLVALAITIPMIWVCWIVSIIVTVLYAGFISFNIFIDRYCKKLIEKGNKETEEYAKLNNYDIKKVPIDVYNQVTQGKSGDLGDGFYVAKEDIQYI